MTSNRDKENRAVRLGIIVLLGTLFGVLAYNKKLDDVGRFVLDLFN